MCCSPVVSSLQSLLTGASSVPSLAPAVKAVGSALSRLGELVQGAAARPPSYLELAARDLSYSLARTYMGSLHITNISYIYMLIMQQQLMLYCTYIH